MPDEIETTTSGEDNSRENADVVVGEGDKKAEKKDWVEEAIEYEATPDRLREPKLQQDFIKNLGIPRSTYFYTLAKPENQKIILDICFRQAKRRTPNILDKMGQKAEEGNDKSQEMFMDYVLELKKKLALVGGDENDKAIEFVWKENKSSLITSREDGPQNSTKPSLDGSS